MNGPETPHFDDPWPASIAALRIEVRLRLEPVTALLQDVRAVLLDRVPGLFFRVTPWRQKKRDRLDVDVAMPRPARRSQSSSSV